MKDKILLVIFLLITIFNISDALLTNHWVGNDMASEANPLMKDIIEKPVLFMAVKLSLMCLGLYLLWRLRNVAFTRVLVGSCIVMVVLTGVFGYHVYIWYCYSTI